MVVSQRPALGIRPRFLNDFNNLYFGETRAYTGSDEGIRGHKEMTTTRYKVLTAALGLGFALNAMAQDQQPRAWRKVTDPAPAQNADQNTDPNQQQNQDTLPLGQNPVPDQSVPVSGQDRPADQSYPTSFPPSVRGQQQYQYPPMGPNAGAPGAQMGSDRGFAGARPQAAVPPQLQLKPGTFVTVRVNNVLSSDRNQQGDAFTATLVKPVVVDGVVVARAGETIAGRVTEAQKAGRVSGTSRLGVQLTELSLVDGSQVPVQTDLMTRNGRTTVGNDVGAVAGTTAVGAAIGAGVDWGRGAAIGAGAGAAAGILGVLLTRGQPTILTPETLLTFRITNAITINTDRAPQAFRFATESDYQPGLQQRSAPPARVAYGPAPFYPAPYYAPYYGPAYLYGPTVGVYIGPRYHYRRW